MPDHNRTTTTSPQLPKVRLNICTPRVPARAVVVSNERCTERKSAHFVRHICLDVSGTPLVGQFRPGQSFGVIPPGTDERGRPHNVRLYSISSPTRGEDGQARVIATTVKRTIDEHWQTRRLFLGVASNYLCDLQPGETVLITGPAGKRFLLPEDPSRHDYLFFATGTGIAPFRGMLLDLIESGVRSRIVLVMGVAYATDLLYHAALLKLQSEHEHVRYITAISRERQEDGHDPLYVQDRLETHANELLPMLESERTLVYICGVEGMELGIFQRMAMMLPDHALQQYVQVDAGLLADIRSWRRSMLHRQIRHTSRVFVEVY